ncbi:MAG: hypothetical protein IJJ42_03120 [Clostridia bacterium]|nr:hypothetical protein [Clostridia bacterium]
MRNKLICWILLLTLTLSCCLGAQAEDGSRLTEIIKAGEALLFQTDNVTLKGEASFTLDGEDPFKKAEAEYVQDGTFSYWRLKLLTPWPEGERLTGFTVIANDRKIYAMEDFHPGVYRMGDDEPQNTLLRKSPFLTQLMDLAGFIAPEWEKTLSGKLQTGEDGTVSLQLTKADVPESLNSLMNLGAQLMIRRLFQIDYDRMSGYEHTHMADFTTVTQAILGSTVRFTLQEAQLKVRLDDKGRIAEAAGTVKADFETYNDGTHTLAFTFSGEAGEYGASKVESFDPAAYGVTEYAEGPGDIYIPVDTEYQGETFEYEEFVSTLFRDWEPAPRDDSAVSLPVDESAFSARWLKIRQAEQALLDRYGIRPEMLTFFSRKVTEEDGSLTLSLTGMNDFCVALGTYTAEVTADGVKTAWSHDGEKADSDAFTAPVWGIAQLEKMLEITKRDHEVTSFYTEAVRIARESDSNYEMPFDSLCEYVEENLNPEIIRSRCRYTLEELAEIGRQTVTLTFGLTDAQKDMLWAEDDYPEYHFMEKDGRLIYQAWMNLMQEPYPAWTEHDGMYEVLINAENGQIEDLIYDAGLNGNG